MHTSRNISKYFRPSEGNICINVTLKLSRVTRRCIYQRLGYYYVIIGAYEEITDCAVSRHATVFSQARKR